MAGPPGRRSTVGPVWAYGLCSGKVLREVLMAIVGGLDLHRKQITFDLVEIETGRVERGRIAPAHRETFRRWLTGVAAGGPVDLAVEGCTGCRGRGVRDR